MLICFPQCYLRSYFLYSDISENRQRHSTFTLLLSSKFSKSFRFVLIVLNMQFYSIHHNLISWQASVELTSIDDGLNISLLKVCHFKAFPRFYCKGRLIVLTGLSINPSFGHDCIHRLIHKFKAEKYAIPTIWQIWI